MRVPKVNSQSPNKLTDEEVRRWIAEAAYYRAEKRGFMPGMETEDWIAAEAEILARHPAGEARA